MNFLLYAIRTSLPKLMNLAIMLSGTRSRGVKKVNQTQSKAEKWVETGLKFRPKCLQLTTNLDWARQ